MKLEDLFGCWRVVDGIGSKRVQGYRNHAYTPPSDEPIHVHDDPSLHQWSAHSPLRPSNRNIISTHPWPLHCSFSSSSLNKLRHSYLSHPSRLSGVHRCASYKAMLTVRDRICHSAGWSFTTLILHVATDRVTHPTQSIHSAHKRKQWEQKLWLVRSTSNHTH